MTSQEKINHFRSQSESNYVFACHAAVPLVLTVDLLYALWHHFKTYHYADAPNQAYSIAPIAVSDFLLSRLCREVGFEVFELEKEVRTLLGSDLEMQLGATRKFNIATFLKAFASQPAPNPHFAYLKEIHLLTALSILSPQQLEKQIIQNINHAENDEAKIKQLLLHHALMNPKMPSALSKISGAVAESNDFDEIVPVLIETDDENDIGVFKLELPEFLQGKVRFIKNKKIIYDNMELKKNEFKLLIHPLVAKGELRKALEVAIEFAKQKKDMQLEKDVTILQDRLINIDRQYNWGKIVTGKMGVEHHIVTHKLVNYFNEKEYIEVYNRRWESIIANTTIMKIGKNGTFMGVKKMVHQFIIKNKIEKAVEYLKGFVNAINLEALKTIQYNYWQLSEQVTQGWLLQQEITSGYNQINLSILNLLNDLEEKTESKAIKNVNLDLNEALMLELKTITELIWEDRFSIGYQLNRMRSAFQEIQMGYFECAIVHIWAQFNRNEEAWKHNIIHEEEYIVESHKIKKNIINLIDKFNNNATSIGNQDSDSFPLKVLMLANPHDKLQKEFSYINQKLVKKEKEIQITRLDTIISIGQFMAIVELQKINIIHISGDKRSGIKFYYYKQDTYEKVISPDGLDTLFEYFKNENLPIKAVILNACYTQEQAQIIANHIPYVIGVSVVFVDDLTIAFNGDFYLKLAETNFDFESAFKYARMKSLLKGMSKYNFVLYKYGEIVDI